MVRAPLFLVCAFVGMDVERPHPLNSTVGVSELICRGGRPAPVPDAAVEEIRDHEDENGYVVLSRRSAPRPGDRVRITQGAMADRIGIFVGPSDRRRVFCCSTCSGARSG